MEMTKSRHGHGQNLDPHSRPPPGTHSGLPSDGDRKQNGGSPYCLKMTSLKEIV